MGRRMPFTQKVQALPFQTSPAERSMEVLSASSGSRTEIRRLGLGRGNRQAEGTAAGGVCAGPLAERTDEERHNLIDFLA